MNSYQFDRLRWILGKYIAVAATFNVPNNVAQELFVDSKFYQDIENNKYSNIFEEDEIIIENILGFKFGVPYYDTISLWAGEAYLYLFVELEKPIEYLFLYLHRNPVRECILYLKYLQNYAPQLI